MSNPAFTFDHIHIISQTPHESAKWYVEMFGAEIVADTIAYGAPQIFLELGGKTLIIRGHREGETPVPARPIQPFARFSSHNAWGTDHFGFLYQCDNHDGGSPHLRHDPPVDVELLEDEGQRQRQRRSPGPYGAPPEEGAQIEPGRARLADCDVSTGAACFEGRWTRGAKWSLGGCFSVWTGAGSWQTTTDGQACTRQESRRLRHHIETCTRQGIRRAYGPGEHTPARL